jgi:hypothetical protein
MKTCASLLLLSLGLAAPAAAQVPGLNIDLRAGVNVTDVGDAPDGTDADSEFGWFVGGDVRFASSSSSSRVCTISSRRSTSTTTAAPATGSACPRS